MKRAASFTNRSRLVRFLLSAQDGYSTHCFDDKSKSLELLSAAHASSSRADPTKAKAFEKECSTLSTTTRLSLVYAKFRALTVVALVRWWLAHAVSATLGGVDSLLVGFRAFVGGVLHKFGLVKHAKVTIEEINLSFDESEESKRAAARVISKTPAGPPRFFHDGWGDIDRIKAFYDSLEEAFHTTHDNLLASPPSFAANVFTATHGRYASCQHTTFTITPATLRTVELEYVPPSFAETCDVYEFSFTSPMAPLLGSPAGDPYAHEPLLTAHFFLVWPKGRKLESCFVTDMSEDAASASASASASDAEKRIAGMALLMPATGEQLAGERLALAHEYAEQGHASLIVTAPFYGGGRRRPPLQTGSNLRTVSAMLLQVCVQLVPFFLYRVGEEKKLWLKFFTQHGTVPKFC